MRIALGQQVGQRRDRRERRKRCCVVQRFRGKRTPHFDTHMPELIGEACFPSCVDVIAGLQHGAETPRSASVNEAQMAAVSPRP